MRIEDMSQSGSNAVSDQSPDLSAHNDYDVIPAGAHAPATGNAITGSGTVSGAAGADSLGSGNALITSITGAGGTDSSFAGGHLEIAGKFGVIRIDSHGNYNYARNPDSPDGVTDTFTYALSDRAGGRDTATLSIRIEAEPIAFRLPLAQLVSSMSMPSKL